MGERKGDGIYAPKDNHQTLIEFIFQLLDLYIIPGFKLKPEWLWQAATLSPLFCFLEIDGVEEELHRQHGRPI